LSTHHVQWTFAPLRTATTQSGIWPLQLRTLVNGISLPRLTFKPRNLSRFCREQRDVEVGFYE
jgi:hypothetical protein